MDTILVPGYPKSGNTLLGTALNLAGSVKTDFDIYALKSQNIIPDCNNLFESPLCTIKTHQMRRYNSKFENLYFGKVIKIITIARNPLETLLS